MKFISNFGKTDPEGWHLYVGGSVNIGKREARGLTLCGLEGEDEPVTTLDNTVVDTLDKWAARYASPYDATSYPEEFICYYCSQVVALDLHTDARYVDAIVSIDIELLDEYDEYLGRDPDRV